MEYMYDYLTKLKKEVNSHTFIYEDGCFINHLIEYHTVEIYFNKLYEQIENEKVEMRTNYYDLYCLQSALTDLLLCEKQIAKDKFYLKKIYGDVVSASKFNQNLDYLIKMYD